MVKFSEGMSISAIAVRRADGGAGVIRHVREAAGWRGQIKPNTARNGRDTRSEE